MHRVGAQITPTYRVDTCSRSVFSTVFARGAERCGLWLPLLLQQLVCRVKDESARLRGLCNGRASVCLFRLSYHSPPPRTPLLLVCCCSWAPGWEDIPIDCCPALSCSGATARRSAANAGTATVTILLTWQGSRTETSISMHTIADQFLLSLVPRLSTWPIGGGDGGGGDRNKAYCFHELHGAKFAGSVGHPITKILSASGGLRPLTPWPGALPLDPAGGSAPRPPL